MSAFHLFQPVRIVRCDTYPSVIGRECILLEWCEFHAYGRIAEGWETSCPHPDPLGHLLCLPEDHFEPIKYLPAPEDFASIEGCPDFDCPLPDLIERAA